MYVKMSKVKNKKMMKKKYPKGEAKSAVTAPNPIQVEPPSAPLQKVCFGALISTFILTTVAMIEELWQSGSFGNIREHEHD